MRLAISIPAIAGGAPPGPPMTLGNMRSLGVQRLIASCLNDACRHTAPIDVSSYPAETEILYFSSHVVCDKRGTPMRVDKATVSKHHHSASYIARYI